MLWDRESLLTKVTVCPTEMVTWLGFTPADVMVTVAPLPPPGGGLGEGVVELPPHAVMKSAPNNPKTMPMPLSIIFAPN